MNWYTLWDSKKDTLIRHTPNVNDIGTAVLGRDVRYIKIYKDGKLVKPPYECDVYKLQKQIEMWPLSYNDFLNDGDFEI